jgi:hypothetical protein
MGKSAVRRCWSINPGSSRFFQIEVAGDEISMQVRLQDMSYLKTHLLGRIQIGTDVSFWVDDCTDVIPGYHVGAMGDAGDEKLMDDHHSHLLSD